MADPARAKKIADRIKVIVAETLEFRVKDERLGFVTITDVRVTGDLQNASVFYTVFGGEEERAETAAALESAKGKLRAAVGKGIGIRLTPTLEFFADALPDTAAHMEALLREAKERDAAVAAAASGAVYAGESDPYRKPADELEQDVERPRTSWRRGLRAARRRCERAGRGREGPMTAADRSVASDGLLVVDKPAGWTSHDVVAKARGLCGTRRVGHAGTLDPMATGVLVLGVNRATKLLTFLVGCDKTYTATIRLGQSTLTDDAEGEVTAAYDVSSVTSQDVEGGRGRAHRRPASRCPARSARSRSTASAPTPGSVPARTSSSPARPVTVHRFVVLASRVVDGRRPRRARPRRRGRGVLRHLRPGPGPRPRRRARASVVTSPRCGARASAGSTSPPRRRWSSCRRPGTRAPYRWCRWRTRRARRSHPAS